MARPKRAGRKTYRCLPIDPCWIQAPSKFPDQRYYRNPHLQEGKFLSQARTTPPMEAGEFSLGSPLPVLFLDSHCRLPPSTRVKDVGSRAPNCWVTVGRVAVVAQVCPLWDDNIPAQQDILGRLPVNQLADGREKPQAFVDDRGQKRHVLERFRIRVLEIQPFALSFGVKLVLHILCTQSATDPIRSVFSLGKKKLTGCFAKR